MAREMKDSGIEWIGSIPEQWFVPKLLYVLRDKICDGPHETPNYIENGIPFISIDSLNDTKTINLQNVKRFISEEAYEQYCKKTKIEPGDILFSKAATIGKTAIVRNELLMVWSPLAVIKNNPEKINNNYLYYLLNCSHLINSIALSGSINTQINVGMREMEQARIPLPPLCEQELIVAFLDNECQSIDAAISQTRAAIEEYKKLKQAVITQAVTKGIRTNREMKDSGTGYIRQIPIEWEVVKLRYLGICQNGISKGGEYFGSGFPFVSYSDVYKNMELPLQVDKLVESTEEEQDRYSVIEGDIFFTRTSETIEEIGFTSVCKQTIEKATFAGFLIRVRPVTQKLLIGFSKYYFRSEIHRQYFVKEMNLVTRASLGQELLKNMPVLVPSITEQSEIVAYLDEKTTAIDSLIQKKEQLITELEAYKRSLIYEYVTGKKEVPVHAH